jgi:hypothetical protein
MRVVVSNQRPISSRRAAAACTCGRRGVAAVAPFTTLATSSDPPRRREFVRVETAEEFELYLDARLRRLPDELPLDLRRFPRRVETNWNGCALVV